MARIAYYREDDKELMGYVEDTSGTYSALTIFGYPIKEGLTEQDAKNVLLEKGLSILMENWEFRTSESDDWKRCIIVEAAKDKVKVAKFDGYYPDTSKTYTLRGNLRDRLRL
jgi:hypothetical protein